MPKRWIVTFSGDVFDRLNGADAEQFSGLLGKVRPNRVVDADELIVNGGALVFIVDGEERFVFGPGSYWYCELADQQSGAVQAADTSDSS